MGKDKDICEECVISIIGLVQVLSDGVNSVLLHIDKFERYY